jgi:hypothetical protein
VAILLWVNGEAEATSFTGCFASGPALDGTADPNWDADVDKLTGALIRTGSWAAGGTTKLKNGRRAQIETCVGVAKGALTSGDEFVFFFSGHGGDSFFPDAAELGEGGGSDNHLRIGNTAGGVADRMSDDQLATLLSGFQKSVTINVILDSCFSHTFTDGANDLSSITQVNGAPAAVGNHLGFLAASSVGNPTCLGGFTDRLVQALEIVNGVMRADTNKDGTLTTREAGQFTGAYTATGPPKCDQQSSSACPPDAGTQQSTTISPACSPLDPICPRLAEAVPEPGTLTFVVAGLVGAAIPTWLRMRRRQGDMGQIQFLRSSAATSAGRSSGHQCEQPGKTTTRAPVRWPSRSPHTGGA